MRRSLIRTIRDLYDTTRREAVRFLVSPGLAFGHIRFRLGLLRRDWKDLHAKLRPLAAAARRSKDHRVLTELGQAALRLDEPQLGAQLVQESRVIAGRVEPTDWRGEDIHDATLIVRVAELANQGIGGGMRQVGQIATAAARAARTVLIVESRMVPLFARTLPDAVVVPFGTDVSPFKSGKFVTASITDIEAALNFSAAELLKGFRPLVPDRQRADLLREKYRRGRGVHLVGISWWSSHYGKDLPTPRQWMSLLREVPAQFVSLQYGDVGDDLALFNANDAHAVIADPEIDQMRDMDSFASQIAALDLVVTISNSAAHLTGSLGQKMILVRDDLFRRNWPHLSRSVPWYPNTTVIGKDGRNWSEAFGEIVAAARNSLREG